MSSNLTEPKKKEINDDSNKKTEKKQKRNIFVKSIVHKKIFLSFQSIGSNLLENIEKNIKEKYTEKCCKEGYISKLNLNIISFSPGVIQGNNVVFDVIFECLVCKPIIGQTFKCKIKNITKAGIRAQYVTGKGNSPVTVYLARDNHYKNEYYNSIKENKNQTLKIKVLGVRFELNDDTIYVLGELLRVYKNETQQEKISIN
tara:strand:+ start:1757 stop:2359 length:603 start_codon:yes stop_codon:yes gene_type:complete